MLQYIQKYELVIPWTFTSVDDFNHTLHCLFLQSMIPASLNKYTLKQLKDGQADKYFLASIAKI